MSLQHIHLFESRKATFHDADILQESVITKTTRSALKPNHITITTSFAADLPPSQPCLTLEASQVIDDSSGDFAIRIPENEKDARIMRLLEAWPRRFAEHGFRVSTGPIVMFRATEFLRDSKAGADTVPLLCVHNVRPFQTIWPVQKNGKPIAFKVNTASLSRRLLLPTKNYVLLRRFSAKEDRRRLTASCLLRSEQRHAFVALENHLNYVFHAQRELTDNEAYGIAALFNSALLDRYFRTLSGNTQVNATEIRTMPFPDLKTVTSIGRRARRLRQLDQLDLEHVVLDELGVHGTLERYLKDFTS